LLAAAQYESEVGWLYGNGAFSEPTPSAFSIRSAAVA
jgi:hypothetical protein